MGGAVYIGDEAHAAAWRLAGVDARIAAAGAIDTMFAEACASADLVLLSAASAAHLPQTTLDQARRATAPLLLVLPGVAVSNTRSELALRVRRQLGMDAS
jgi:vacuolar-type H+-ATPase subunit F/Vma7